MWQVLTYAFYEMETEATEVKPRLANPTACALNRYLQMPNSPVSSQQAEPQFRDPTTIVLR